MDKPHYKKKKLHLGDFASPLLLERGELLGWEPSTPIDLLAEVETSRLILTRNSPYCCMCGDGNFRYLLHVGGKHVCEGCASEVHRILREYYQYRRQPPPG